MELRELIKRIIYEKEDYLANLAMDSDYVIKDTYRTTRCAEHDYHGLSHRIAEVTDIIKSELERLKKAGLINDYMLDGYYYVYRFWEQHCEPYDDVEEIIVFKSSKKLSENEIMDLLNKIALAVKYNITTKRNVITNAGFEIIY